jgi:hypothetical protein
MKSSNGFKICSGCKSNLPTTKFHKNKTQPDGLNNWCKDCLVEFRNSYREKKHEYDKQYFLEHSEKKKQVSSEWYYANHEYGKEVRRNYHQNHKEEHSKRMKQWRENNPERVREIHHKQTAKRRQMGFFKLWDNPFSDDVKIDYHHINDLLVVPMPKRIHNKCSHLNPEEHRERCNVWLYYLYGMDIGRLLE